MTISGSNLTAASDWHTRPAIFIEAEFLSGTVRLWTGYGTVMWGGRVWYGGGDLLAISALEQTNDVTAKGATVTLSGVSLDMVIIAINEARQGDRCRMYLGFFNEDWTLAADPEMIFAGLLDVPQIEEGDETASITITYESQLITLMRPREWRYTHESQQQLYPGDRGFEFITQIQEVDVKWGR